MKTKVLQDDEYGKIEYKELPVQDGDVVVVKAGISEEALDKLSEMLGKTGRSASIIVAVNKMSDIKSLDQKIMANYGWYRADRMKMATKFLESKIVTERDREDSLAPIYDGLYFLLTGKYYE